MYDELSRLAGSGTPFLFYTDFKGERLHVFPLDTLHEHDIEYHFDTDPASMNHPQTTLQKHPLSYKCYEEKFNRIVEHIKAGDTYLLNLTQPTPITASHTLKEIYQQAKAPFKLRVKDEFICFTPERFITIDDDRIFAYPMKGTIDASIPNAQEKILNNEKEMAEHIMVVDLLRNDLGIVANKIRVEKFRYIDKISAGEKELLQVSSKISGTLDKNWKNRLGDIIKALLPAGSISGTPKKRTVEIIEAVEGYERGYFTGVFGIFDGKSFQSAVMIRYIEKQDDRLLYKSGGGITLDSDPSSEYQELLDKIYIP